MAIPTSAAAKLVSFGSGASGNPGASVTVSINVDNLQSIAGFNINFSYDSSVLTAVDAQPGSGLSLAMAANFTPNLANPDGPGTIRLGTIASSGLSSTSAGELAKITFNILGTAYKNGSLTFTLVTLKDISGAQIAGTTTANGSVGVTGVTITVAVTPASTTNVVAGQAQTLAAEVLVNGTHLDLTTVDDALFITSGSGTFGAKSLSSGKVQVPYTTSTTVQSANITATEKVTLNNNTGTATVASIAGPPDAGTSTVSASPTANVTVAGDASSFSTVTVTLKDTNNNACSNQTVNITLSGTGNSINGTAYTLPVNLATQTNASGVVTFQLSSTKAESKTVTAKVGATTITQTATVDFKAGAVSVVTSTVTAAPASQTTDGGATSTITVTVKDGFGNPISGQAVTLQATGTGNTITQPAATDAGGQTTGTIASTKAEAKTITALAGATAITQTATVTATPGAPAKMTLAASKTTLASDQKGSATLTATILDQNGNLVSSDSSTVVNFALTDATYVSLSAATATASSGVATVTATTKAGKVATPPATTGVDITATGLTPPAATPDLTLTIVNFSIQVDAPAAPFRDGSGIHLVTSGSTPSTATLSGIGSTTGTYRWTLASVGTISSGTADTITYTAPATITGNVVKDTVTLKSSSDAALSDSLDIYIHKPMSITSPTTAIGIAVGDNAKIVTASGGTGAYGFQSTATGVATVNATTGAIAPVAAGTLTVQARDATYGDFAVNNGFLAVTPNIQIVNPIAIGGRPAGDAMGSGTQNSFTATGGTGQVNWEAAAGAIDATGKFTAPAITTGSQAVKITAYDKTYNKTSASPIKSEYTLTVFAGVAIMEKPAGYVDGQPSTYPILALGKTVTFSAADGTRSYDWTVKDWNGATIVTQTTGAADFDVNPDALFAASGAGIYTVSVADKNNPGFAAGTLNVRVPMRFVATKFNANTGTYKTPPDTSDTYTVTGGPTGNVYTYASYDLNGAAVNPAVYGTFQSASPTNNDNVFTFAAGINELLSYRVKVALNRTAPVAAEVQRLIDAGLDTVWSGIFRIVPVLNLAGTVTELNGTTAVAGATVTATSDATKTATTAADGTFTIANLEFTGATYQFLVRNTLYIDKIVTDEEIMAGPVKLEKLTAGSGSIAGTVTLSDDPVPYASDTVSIQAKTAAGAYVADAAGKAITVLANPATGAYSFPIPAADAADGPFTVEFKKTGYIFDAAANFGVLKNVALNEAAANVTLKPVTVISVTGTAVDSNADLIPDRVLVKITAEAGLAPLTFDGTLGEIKVTDTAGNNLTSTLNVFGSDGANTWSFTHMTYENFTITVWADVSDNRDVATGYKATTTWTYVKSSTAPTETTITNPSINGGQATSATGNTEVNIPPGGLTGDILGSVTVVIVEVDPVAAGAMNVTGSEIVDVYLVDASGQRVPNTSLARIEITLSFDPSVVTPGTLENGTFVIFQANTVADLIAGNATPVPTSQLILPIDYTNGFVTFWVNHLSAFGIGASSPAAAGGGGGDGGGCFIASAGDKASSAPFMGLLMLFLVAGAYALLRRAV
jgi:hypothetical protein